MIRLNIPALSINNAYRGRRFATQALKRYKDDISYLLPKIIVPKGKLALMYRFGMSSKLSDADNGVKAFQDCLAEVYGFNDRVIYKISIEKIDVPKGKEFIEFEISPYLALA